MDQEKKQAIALMRYSAVVGSPTKYTVQPRCIRRLAKPLAANPDLPAPPTKILFAFTISSSTPFSCSASIYFV